MRKTLLLIGLLVAAMGCKPDAGSSDPQSPAARVASSGLDSDLAAILANETVKLDAKPTTEAGKAFLNLLSTRERSRAEFDKAMELYGVGKIADAKPLSTAEGRKQAHSMLINLRTNANRKYDLLSISARDLAAWGEANGKALDDKAVQKAVREARKQAVSTFDTVDDWLKILDEIKPTYEPKTQRLAFKGLQKGAKFVEMSGAINAGAAQWGLKDFDAEQAWSEMVHQLHRH